MENSKIDFSIFPCNFITDTYENFEKNQTFSNTKSIHVPRTSSSPGFIWTRYIWKTHKLIFRVLTCNFITETWEKFKKITLFAIPKAFISQWVARPLVSFELDIFVKLKNWFFRVFPDSFVLKLWKNFEKMTKVCSFSNYYDHENYEITELQWFPSSDAFI